MFSPIQSQLDKLDRLLEDDPATVLEDQDQVVALDQQVRLGRIEGENLGQSWFGGDIDRLARVRPVDQNAGLVQKVLWRLTAGEAYVLGGLNICAGHLGNNAGQFSIHRIVYPWPCHGRLAPLLVFTPKQRRCPK